MAAVPRLIFINRFFHPDHSATSQILGDLAFHLADSGYQVHVLSSRQLYDDPSTVLPANEQIKGVHVHRLWATRLGRGHLLRRAVDYLTFYLSAAFALARYARLGSIIIAETDPPLLSVIAALMAGLRRAKLVNWTQDLFPEIAEHLGVPGIRLAAPLLRWFRNRSLACATANVALSDGMAERLRVQGARDGSVHVVHNWSPVEGQPLATDNPLRAEWNLERKFVVGYSGNFGRAHDFTTVVDAAALLRDVPDVRFLFVGAGAKQAWLQERVASLRLGNITFQPYQPIERLALSLAVPDVHLVSLRPELEGLIVPSKFYSVLASARPTLFIGDTQSEMAKGIADAHCGYSFPIGASAELASTIGLLAANPAEVIAMGQRARALWEKQFRRERALAAWEKLLAVVSV